MLKKILTLITVLTLQSCASEETMAPIYNFEVTSIEGKTTMLSSYRGQVMLIVNVASQCGFTPQYEGLEALYEKYKDQGFVVLGFPCNQFGSQEPGSEAEIRNFCTMNFGVSFPMFSKIDVNGDNTHPLYLYLKSQKSGFMGSESIKWNFTKFLIDKQGNVIDRYASATKPKSLEKDIEKLLE